MIERYAVPEITELWSEEAKFNFFLQVECALMKAQEEAGLATPGGAALCQKTTVNLQRIKEIEAEVQHDVIAFTTSIAEQLPLEVGRYFHFGVTSSDIIDTALALQIKASENIVHRELNNVCSALTKLIHRTKHLLSVGRSHGISAEVMIFAQKWTGHLAEFKRRQRDLEAHQQENYGQFSGAIGNFMVLNHEIEKAACSALNLQPMPGTTQVIARDIHAKKVLFGALLATAIERLAQELRLLQHSDIHEASEGFRPGQKGSSTMPHKKNPISSENLCGLARMIRSSVSVSLENCLLWHERDISHSSAERIYFPQMYHLLTYALKRLANVLEHLVIHEEVLQKKVEERPELFSSALLHSLIISENLSREELYRMIQKVFFARPKTLEQAISSIEKELGHPVTLSKQQLVTHLQDEFLLTLAAIEQN